MSYLAQKAKKGLKKVYSALQTGLSSSDEPEPEFSSSSRAVKVPSRAEALLFPSWNRADNMYVKK
jgi:hypothetical protein